MIEPDFISISSDWKHADVLDLGTLRAKGGVQNDHIPWCHPTAKVVRSDFQAGLDVDVLADIHKLTETFPEQSFDMVICCAVFEHVKRPWIAAVEIAKVLKPGGLVYVQTHQSFPIHAVPHDYWRFTTDGLKTLFEDAGLETVCATYRYPAQVVSEKDPDGKNHKAFLNVNIVSKRVS